MPSPTVLRALSRLYPIHFLDADSGPDCLRHSEGKAPFGLLTVKGLAQTNAVGKSLRRLYVDRFSLLPEQSTCSAAGSIKVRSTSLRRTVQSSQSFLAGFCNCDKMAEISTGRVAIEVESKGSHLMLPNFNFMLKRCPQLAADFQENVLLPRTKRGVRSMAPIMAELKRHYPLFSSSIPETSKLLWAFDHFKCLSAHNLPSPTGTQTFLKPLRIWAQDHFWWAYSSSARLQASFLLKNVARRMSDFVNGEASVPKFFLYSGHDTTIMPLLCALGAVPCTWSDKWPGYADHVMIELWEKGPSSERSFGVRIVYNDEVRPLSGSTSDVTPLDKFAALFDIPEEELTLACASSVKVQNPFQVNR